eukprot:TRINITY_DN2072_c0_g1_i3.p1 TRINITY_DN2072_c0_g1~~TRINITY_DN2072_c0_g1_i3.p1  ORF type:complete len:178 (-),score=24.01 TRINITY_DN2072_c0_g1_i3:72-563(-)
MSTPTGVAHVMRLCRDAYTNIARQGMWRTAVRFARMREVKFGNLIGSDKFGNMYYEDKQEVWGRHRWVEYPGGLPWEQPKESTTVPPEWHSWLHYISDYPGNSQEILSLTPSRFKMDHLPNQTASETAYAPHNHILNPNYGKQNMNHYEEWRPNSTEGKRDDK